MKRIQRILALVLVLALALPGFGVTAGAAGLPFRDVEQSAWYYDAVAESYDRGLMSGVSDTAFDPDGSMTRAMFVTVLGRLMGVEDGPSAGGSFGDVQANSWYASYVAWAVDKGITQGTSDTTFSPEELVTREQAATFLFRCLEAENLQLPDQGGAASFPDGGSISAWAQESVEVLAAAGIFVGDEAGNFRPAATMTRAEAATILVRFADSLETGPAEPENNAYDFDAEDLSLDEDTGITYVNNILLVFFEQNATQQQKDAVVDAVDGTVAGRMDTIGQLQIRVEARDLAGLEALAAQVEDMAGVYCARYDLAARFDCDFYPNDPWGGGEDWDVSAPAGNNWWVEAVDAPGAWDYAGELAEIGVGIVDNGFDTSHEDLTLQILNTDRCNTEDHGTHVAGIVGAEPGNGRGIAGMAPNARLLCYDWQPSDAQQQAGGWDTNTAVLLGLVECVQEGARVVNFSLGKSSNLDTNNDVFSSDFHDAEAANASAYMAALLSRGFDFLVVQSAGNGAGDGIGVDAIHNGVFCSITDGNCPAYQGVSTRDIQDRILIVAASSQPGTAGRILTRFSNGGAQVDIAAPGDTVYSAVPGGYVTMSGTSMSAPVVAGAAAVVWGMAPSLTGPEVRRYLLDNYLGHAADNPDSPNATRSFPIVNVHQAVEAVRADKLGDADYSAVLAEYVSACSVGRDSFLERWEKGEYRYVNVTEVNDYYNYGYTLYSAEYDVNGDGVPEFLIAKEEGGDYVLIGFYAYNGAILSPFGDGGGGFGYRVRLYLCEGGVLCVQGSDSAFSGSAALYRISGDGGSLEQIASYRYDSRDPDAMTYEEVEAALARYPRLDHRSLSWQELAGPAPEEISPEELAEAVLAAEDSLWGPVYTQCTGYVDGEDTQLYFMDLDLDGTPEFLIQTPPLGTGYFTSTYAYRYENGVLRELTGLWPEADSSWDELFLCRDRADGTLFFASYDYVRAGYQWYGEDWSRCDVTEAGGWSTSPLFSTSCEGGTMYYYLYGSTSAVSQTEYERQYAAFWDGVDQLGTPWGERLQDWNSAASHSSKLALLVQAIETVPALPAA